MISINLRCASFEMHSVRCFTCDRPFKVAAQFCCHVPFLISVKPNFATAVSSSLFRIIYTEAPRFIFRKAEFFCALVLFVCLADFFLCLLVKF